MLSNDIVDTGRAGEPVELVDLGAVIFIHAAGGRFCAPCRCHP